MKIAVTGATGFIGRHVLAELEKRPVETIALVRDSATDPNKFSGSRLVQLDLHEKSADAFDLMGRPDVLIHLAWSGLPNYKSLHHFEHELPAQYRFLKNLVTSGLQSLVITGTCFEYGMQSGALSEELEPRPSNPYGFAKDSLRRQLEFLKADHPFRLTWARLFYLYGEGQAETSLLPQLRMAVARGEKAFNMSGGEQLRDYLPVTEVARHLVSLSLENEENGVVNVCSGTPISVKKLVEGWIKKNKWSISFSVANWTRSSPGVSPRANCSVIH